VSLVVSVVVKLDNVRHDDQLEQSSKNVGTVVASESFHDPKKTWKPPETNLVRADEFSQKTCPRLQAEGDHRGTLAHM
jgi:hypothetical protein